MTDLSRRNFLKGLMATAGVVAAGMPVLAAVEAAVAPPLPFPDHLLGDVFMKVDDVWRFLGKSMSWTVNMEREVSFRDLEEDFSGYRTAFPGLLTREADVEIMMDGEGRQMLMSQFLDRGRVDFAMSQGRNGLYTLKGSTISSASVVTSREVLADRFHLELGEIEVTFPTAEAA